MRVFQITLILVVFGPGLAKAAVAPTPIPVSANVVASNAPPVPKPPVDIFRDLLAMGPAERAAALASKQPQQRDYLLAKLKEYSSLNAEDREVRLRLLELRWHLVPLMRMSPTNRAARLALVSTNDRPLIEERLLAWDAVPAELQQQFLTHESTIHYFIRLQADGEANRDAVFQGLPAEHRQKIEAMLVEWTALPVERRDQMVQHFHQFFEMNNAEQRQALRTLSETERGQMEESLARFENLTPEARRQCIKSFRRFASLTPQERVDFLRNAQRWEAMTPAEREAWRQLVRNVKNMPPLPGPLQGFPPVPGAARAQIVSTNR